MTESTSTDTQKQDAQKQILNRLNRARGQLNGVISAVENGKSCRETITQLSAVSSAIDKAGFAIIASAMAYCVADETGKDDDDDTSLTIAELEKIFLMLA